MGTSDPDLAGTWSEDPRGRELIEALPDEPVPTPAELVALARRFHRQLRVALNFAIEMSGLSYARFEVLEALANDPDHHAAAIAHHLRHDPAGDQQAHPRART